MACDMPKPYKFPFLDSCKKRFLQTHNEVHLALHPVVGLVLRVGDAGKFPQALGFESLDPFFRVSKEGPCLTATKSMAVMRDLYNLNLLAKLMVFLG